MKILIVDDEQLDLFISKKLLSLKFEVEGFNVLSEAVLWAAKNDFDVLISDYHLNDGIQAFDVLTQIKTVKPQGFKAFVLSNHIDDQQAAELKKAGFNGVVEKPISLDKFNALLEAFS